MRFLSAAGEAEKARLDTTRKAFELEKAEKAAEKLGIDYKRGVYALFNGPCYESAAEIRAFAALGADAVGMSTACEAIAANHAGMRAVGISCISNMACGITENPLTHAEVQETADRVAPLFKKLVTESVIRLGKEV